MKRRKLKKKPAKVNKRKHAASARKRDKARRLGASCALPGIAYLVEELPHTVVTEVSDNGYVISREYETSLTGRRIVSKIAGTGEIPATFDNHNDFVSAAAKIDNAFRMCVERGGHPSEYPQQLTAVRAVVQEV